MHFASTGIQDVKSATQIPSSDHGHSVLAVAAGLVLLVVLAYGNSLWNRFTMDDDFIIVDNPMIRHLETMPRLFATDYWAREGATDHLVPRTTGLYRPLVLVSYAVNYQITELQPWSYHLVNILLHGLCTWLIFLIALRIGMSMQGSAVAAALFAIHPLHTEVVSGVVGRAELMMAAALLGGLWWAIERRLWLSLGAFLAGLLSKEQTVMLPAIIILYDLCSRKQTAVTRSKRANLQGTISRSDRMSYVVRRYGPYLLILGGYLIARGLALGTLSIPAPAFLDNPLASAETGERILTALKVAGRYLWLCLWPAALSADYSYNAIEVATSFLEPGVLFGMLTWGALTAWMVRSYVKDDRRIAFSIGFTILVFLPVSNLLVPIGTIMGERLFYLPSAGLCLLLGIIYERTAMSAERGALNDERPLTSVFSPTGGEGRVRRNVARRTVLDVLIVLLCLALLARTYWRNPDWMDNGTLFRSAGKIVPSSAKIRAYLGRVAQSERDWDQARSNYEAATLIYPRYVQTDASLNVNLGDVYFKLGNLEKAAESLERGIRLAPSSAEAHYNLGLVYARLGRYRESEPMVRKALVLRPEFPEAQNTLSRLLVEFGQYQDALLAADRALAGKPDFREAHYNRGLALQALGRRHDAASEFQQAREGERAPQPIPGIVAQ